jgi:hypothetical protein
MNMMVVVSERNDERTDKGANEQTNMSATINSDANIAKRPKRTELDRTIERMNLCMQTLEGIWASAARRGETHQSILKETLERVYGSAQFKKLPLWAQAKVQGFHYGVLVAAQQWALVNAWEYQGIIYANNWDKLPEEVKEAIRKDEIKLQTVWYRPSVGPEKYAFETVVDEAKFF